MKKIIHVFYLLWVALTFVVIMLSLFWIYFVFALFPLKVQLTQLNLTHRFWAHLWLTLIGIRIRVYRTQDSPRTTSVLVMNHNSVMDLPTSYYAVHHRFKTLGKKSVNRVPVLGQIIALSAVSVDRKDAESRKRSMEKMKATIRKGVSILIYPEGTQNRTGETLAPFYAGAFRLAIETGVPVVPIVLLGTKQVMPQSHILKLRPGKIQVHYLPPILPRADEPGEEDRLKNLVYDSMKAFIESKS